MIRPVGGKCPAVDGKARVSMTHSRSIRLIALTALLVGAPVFARHAPPPPPPAPLPPPPPVVEATPPRPMPPGAAAFNIVPPPIGSDGQRVSPNRNITPAQMLWNLRSGWNVAALNCPMPQYEAVSDGYRGFLKRNAKVLKATNSAIDGEFRAQYGPKAGKIREAYMTQVYNHFSLPPTLVHFCDAAAAMTRDIASIPGKDLTAFAARELPTLEVVFDNFYDSYAAYTVASLAWDRRYGQLYDAMYGLQYNGPDMPATPLQGRPATPALAPSAGAAISGGDVSAPSRLAADPGAYGSRGGANPDAAPSLGY